MKIDWKKWTQAVACLDLMVSTSFAVISLMVIVTIVYPVWFSDLDSTKKAGLWISFLTDMYSFKDRNVSEKWMQIAVTLLLFFTILGVFAAIFLLVSTRLADKAGNNTWAKKTTCFWIYTNVPVVLTYCMASFIFVWTLVLAIPRVIYLLIVYKYWAKLKKWESQNEYNADGSITVRESILERQCTSKFNEEICL